MHPKRIVIAGGSGFIGCALAREFSARDFEVVVLTRSPRQRTDRIREVQWDGEQAGAWISFLDGADAVINLAGKSINCPHTPANLRAIIESRVNSVNAIAAAIGGDDSAFGSKTHAFPLIRPADTFSPIGGEGRDEGALSHNPAAFTLQTPPRVWVQASATGFYGDTGDVACDETAAVGNDTLANICHQWEAAFTAANVPQTRKVVLRIGFVLGRDGGALPVLSKMTKFFLGGAAGNGRQYLSWIHLADLARMFATAVEDEQLSGTFNTVAPGVVTNAEFMRELRRALHRPWSPPAPAFAVKLGARLMGSEGSLALASQRCVPKRFLEAGFRFRFAGLAPALNDLCSK